MSLRMKALKQFTGTREGRVRIGSEFSVHDDRRASELERIGLAVKMMQPTRSPPEVRNEAAEQGPLPSAGGETGDAAPLQSSPVAPVSPSKSSRLGGFRKRKSKS